MKYFLAFIFAIVLLGIGSVYAECEYEAFGLCSDTVPVPKPVMRIRVINEDTGNRDWITVRRTNATREAEITNRSWVTVERLSGNTGNSPFDGLVRDTALFNYRDADGNIFFTDPDGILCAAWLWWVDSHGAMNLWLIMVQWG